MHNDPHRFELKILHSEYGKDLDWNWPELKAPFWRLCWSSVRGGVFVRGDVDLAMQPDCCYLITPDTSYKSKASCKIDQLFIHFLLEKPYHHPKDGIFEFKLDRIGENLLQQVVANYAGHSSMSMGCRLSVFALCSLAIAQLPEDSFLVQSYDAVVAVVEEWMDQNLNRSILNAEFASKVKMNVRAFTQHYKSITGEDCQIAFRRKRIHHACSLLQFSRLSMDQIADKCGFSDRHHFSHVFSKERGMTPARYRQITMEVMDPHSEKDSYKIFL